MPTRKLTDLFVERVKPPARGRVEYFDASFGGLALRVTERGHKSWSLMYRAGGRQRRLTIGSYPPVKPAQARREAQTALDSARGGADPATEKKARRDARPPDADTFGATVQSYLALRVRELRPRSYDQARYVLQGDALKCWQRRPLAQISWRDVTDVTDAILRRDAAILANRTFSQLRAFFNWAVQKGRIGTSPIAGKKRPVKDEPTRERVLDDDEIRWLWLACDRTPAPYGQFVKLLLLTGQRRSEVAGMLWREVDAKEETWTIPSSRAKNKRTHQVQLSAASQSVLAAVTRIGAGPVFTHSGDAPLSGFSRAKQRIDAAMLRAKRNELGADAEAIPNWTLHDLRRTATTGMARLNFPPHVVDKVLNHTSGTIRGVAAVYNRFEYREERRAALEAWGRFVRELVTEKPANIVALRA